MAHVYDAQKSLLPAPDVADNCFIACAYNYYNVGLQNMIVKGG